MRKEIKNFDKIVGVTLIILTVVSLMINSLQYTNIIYNMSYDTLKLNTLVTNDSFTILLWADNLLIYLFGLLYIISSIKSKKDVLLKISFSIFSILTTLVASTLIINGVASLFGIF